MAKDYFQLEQMIRNGLIDSGLLEKSPNLEIIIILLCKLFILSLHLSNSLKSVKIMTFQSWLVAEV